MREAVLWQALTTDPWQLDGTTVNIELTREEIAKVYLPLAAIINRQQQALGRRTIVGISGPAGSGKTVSAHVLLRLLQQIRPGEVICLGLDGFHFSNAYLNQHMGVDHRGQKVPLHRIKGLPATFDVAKAVALLTRVKMDVGPVAFPVYDRQLHDPVFDGTIVEPAHRIVLFEGNFLYLDEGDWPKLQALFDLRLFIQTSIEALIPNLRARHLRGGKSPDEVEEHMQSVDIPNAMLILRTADQAHILIHKPDGRHAAWWQRVAIGGKGRRQTKIPH
ncbi:MAG TPA: hypothetical protein EYH31_05345 [Anaerolineae bacterium]|nr:hypothetical protein [Anaerolineae bacterium]